MNRAVLLALATLLAAGCGGGPGPASPPEPARPAAEKQNEPAPAPKAEVPEGQTLGYVRVVSLDGNPVAGVRPIATARRNAFTEPVASGPPADNDGRSYLYFPDDKTLFVRGWDPELHWFPNNFFQAVPGTGEVTGEMKLVMVRSAVITATLLRPDGEPAANENAGLMMFHPELGPWWPSDAVTGPGGEVRFAPVPAGAFLLKLKVASGGMLEIPPVPLPPGGEKDLGARVLH